MSNFDMLLDEMHPCCMKEIENEKRKKEINNELRLYDRSYNRLDAHSKIFKDPKYLSSMDCGCCKYSIDYPLLEKTRKEEQSSLEYNNKSPVSHYDSDKCSTEDDVDDEFAALELEFDGIAEQMKGKLMQEYQMADKFKEEMSAIGFSKLKEDSCAHLIELIDIFRQPLVVHIYDQNSLLGARINLYLEKLAGKYLGTKFRRIIRENLNNNMVDKYSIKDISEEGYLLCLNNGELISQSEGNKFGDDEFFRPEDAFLFLENSNILFETMQINFGSAMDQLFVFLNISENKTADEDQEDTNFCTEIGCPKKYPHEHVTKSYDTTKLKF